MAKQCIQGHVRGIAVNGDGNGSVQLQVTVKSTTLTAAYQPSTPAHAFASFANSVTHAYFANAVICVEYDDKSKLIKQVLMTEGASGPVSSIELRGTDSVSGTLCSAYVICRAGDLPELQVEVDPGDGGERVILTAKQKEKTSNHMEPQLFAAMASLAVEASVAQKAVYAEYKEIEIKCDEGIKLARRLIQLRV